jgi:phosphonate transport system substrate-binding protein
MNRFKKAALTLIAVASLITGPAVGTTAMAQSTPAAQATPGNYDKTDWPKELNCGLFGGDDAEAALNDQQPFADYMENWLGIPFKYTTGTSYNAVIESMGSGHTDCGTVGSFSYILAVQEAGAEAIGISVNSSADNPVYDASIAPSYYSVITVKKGSGIQTLADLKGKTFSFVDPASTSGHLIPSADLIAAGIDPEKDLETIYAGSHPTSALSVWSDKVDAAASTETTIFNLAKEGQIDLCFFEDGLVNVPRSQADLDALYASCPDGSMVPIHYSSPIPNSPFSVSKNLPESLKQAIYDALMNIKNDPELIAQTGTWYFDPTGNTFDPVALDHYYDGLRDVATALDLDLQSFGS